MSRPRKMSWGNDRNGFNEDGPQVELTQFQSGTDGDSEENEALLIEDPSANNSGLQQKSENYLYSDPTLQYARRLLYLSHAFAQFSEVSWQFCLTIFLAALSNYQSLLLVSTYGLTTGLGVTLFGSTTGSWIDRTNRLVAARAFIFTENFCVLIATIFCFLLLSPNGETEQKTFNLAGNPTNSTGDRISASGIPNDFNSLFLIVGIHLLGAGARILDASFLVAMERDWVVVMSRFRQSYPTGLDGVKTGNSKSWLSETGDSKSWLSETNVAMKQIDLSCKVVAPAISGFLIGFVNNKQTSQLTKIGGTLDDVERNAGGQFRYAALAVGAINVLALVVEYYCTTVIYQLIPDLAFLKVLEETGSEIKQDEEAELEEELEGEEGEEAEFSSGVAIYRNGLGTLSRLIPQGLRTYIRQNTSFPGIGLAMLYLNALTFDAIMTAYLVWRGMGLETIGVWRGVSSAIGLAGTCVYHWSAKKMTLELTGLWSIIYEFMCLSLSYSSLFVDDYKLSLTMLIGGVCASRIGLWVFDITVTQMMQEYVPDGVRGVVGGVQQSLNAFFNLLSYGLGILFPNPKDFYIYVGAGYASVGCAMVLYALDIFLFPRKENATWRQATS